MLTLEEIIGTEYKEKRHWSIPHARAFPCLLCGHTSAGWDHCHDHGWIRGPLCVGCNNMMTLVDRYIHWDDEDLPVVKMAKYREYHAQCRDCGTAPPIIRPEYRKWLDERNIWRVEHGLAPR